jgi:hypothetical protein
MTDSQVQKERKVDESVESVLENVLIWCNTTKHSKIR